jgi:hypothetical protein
VLAITTRPCGSKIAAQLVVATGIVWFYRSPAIRKEEGSAMNCLMPLLNKACIALLLSLLGDVAFAASAEAEADTSGSGVKQSLLTSASGAWLLVLDSWGGFTGHGKGGVTIASDGTVFAHRLGRRVGKVCRTRLEKAKLQALTRTVSAARPSTWSASYEPAEEKACCDRFTWSLRLHQREADGAVRVTHTGWHEASEDLPQDLRAVAGIAQSVMTGVPASCQR